METVIIGLGMAAVVGLLMFALAMVFDLNKIFKTKGEK